MVRLVGELDVASAPELRCTLVRIAGPAIVVDFTRLTFVDAAGLSALLTVRRQVHARRGELRIVGARGLARRVFEMTELTELTYLLGDLQGGNGSALRLQSAAGGRPSPRRPVGMTC